MKISQLRDNIPSFINSFNNSWPYRHLVIDDFLDDDLAEQIFDNFPTSDAMDIHGSDTKKLFGWQINPISPNYSSKQSIDFLFNYLKQKELRDIFRDVAGMRSQLFSDPDYYGSGLLLAPRGGVHKIHADRTYHPISTIFPRLVLLLYFNKDWLPEYGGGLQLWDQSITKVKTIAPLFNRAVLFEITSTSYHSIQDVTCPANVYRRALNYYYLSDEAPPNSYIHDTMFYPRPNERFSYWKNRALSGFPKNLIATIASRSSVTRRIHSSLRFFFKGQSVGFNRRSASEEERKRWDDFNRATYY